MTYLSEYVCKKATGMSTVSTSLTSCTSIYKVIMIASSVTVGDT